MLYTLNTLKQKLFENVYNVYEVFKNFFGEEYTDLQNLPEDTLIQGFLYDELAVRQAGQETQYEISDEFLQTISHNINHWTPAIFVWWPEVTVSNENDKSVKIQDLYAKVVITMEGTIPYEYAGFQLTRTTFDTLQYSSRYIHSHLPSRESGQLPTFRNPCLGRGPIRNTIADLHNSYEETLWMLFCQELSLYVTVESLTGGPYRKLEEIGQRNKLYNYSHFEYIGLAQFKNKFPSIFGGEQSDEHKEMLLSFVNFFLSQNTLALCYHDRKYKCGMSYYDYMIVISNAFITWFNQYGDRDKVEYLFQSGWLEKAAAIDGVFYSSDTILEHELSASTSPILVFKGEEKHLRIIQSNNAEASVTLLLNQTIAMYLLQQILKIINYHYANEHTITEGGEQDNSSSACEAVYYL